MTSVSAKKMSAAESQLLVVDMQERLLPAMHAGPRALERVLALAGTAADLAIPWLCSEQYPQGLGPTVQPLAALLSADQPALAKLAFSCVGEPALAARMSQLRERAGRRQAIVTGIEAHVCVLQTCLDLLAQGFEVFVVADAVDSRHPANHALALDRMRQAGASIVSTEMVLFEWVGAAGTDAFKHVSRRVKGLS
ncbi:hydrolase [Pigmentiphaga soli]|uniref:Hydrolase n=1 Tax=Pigmentiphaga soli TaxID=1007095 RepID=A0ABP8HNV8_9BURK